MHNYCTRSRSIERLNILTIHEKIIQVERKKCYFATSSLLYTRNIKEEKFSPMP